MLIQLGSSLEHRSRTEENQEQSIKQATYQIEESAKH